MRQNYVTIDASSSGYLITIRDKGLPANAPPLGTQRVNSLEEVQVLLGAWAHDRWDEAVRELCPSSNAAS